MSKKAHPLGNFMDPNSVRLGRLILDTQNPLQDFHDPFEDRPTQSESIAFSVKNYGLDNIFSKGSKLRSYLTDALSAFGERRDASINQLTASEVTTHELLNSGAWFKEACKKTPTRDWIMAQIDDGRDFYLVVGTLIVRDASLTKTVASGKSVGGATKLSLDHVPTGISAMATLVDLGTGAQYTQHTAFGQVVVFEAPGDHIVAVRYRKVRFKWYCSRTVSSSFLEEGTRWKSGLEWRDHPIEDDDDIIDVFLEDVEELELSGGECGTAEDIA